GGVGGEPQADAEPRPAERLAHRDREALELVDHPVDVLGGVDVGAVREVHHLATAVPKPHVSLSGAGFTRSRAEGLGPGTAPAPRADLLGGLRGAHAPLWLLGLGAKA